MRIYTYTYIYNVYVWGVWGVVALVRIDTFRPKDHGFDLASPSLTGACGASA